MSGLCFSELSEDELAYTLTQVERILKPGGLLLVADEVRPRNAAWRLLHSLVRVPLAALAYLVTQQTTRAVAGLLDRLEHAGWLIISVTWNRWRSFIEIVARKPAETSGS